MESLWLEHFHLYEIKTIVSLPISFDCKSQSELKTK